MDCLDAHFRSLRNWRASPLAITVFAVLLRYTISLWPYSGQAEPPLHGDYEAQRHWMEITIALPIHLWYRFDLRYWGLDYPPLTAYVSWLCGLLSRTAEPASMALGLSRGYETHSHKAFMRLTVLVLDLAVFFPAAAVLASRLARSTQVKVALQNASPPVWTSAFLMVLLQPCLLLIDHGHFQYNSIGLGLAMAGAAAVVGGGRCGELLGSVFFSLSLNFKQMALYYAPAFFFFLLASSIWGKTAECGAEGLRGGVSIPWHSVLRRVLGLGVTVVLTFALLWWPFCVYPDVAAGEDCLSSLGQVLRRLFPFSRGLFEDKVANVWFCLDFFLKLKRKLPVQHLAKLALATTLSLLVPVGAELLRPKRPLTARRMVLALVNSSLAFFLCSFQVHEKSLLLPLCPLAFLWEDSPLLVTWVQVVGMFSMKPLLGREGLLVPCAVCTMLYVGASALLAPRARTSVDETREARGKAFPYGSYITEGRLRAMVASSVGGMVALLAFEAACPPPEALPYLHPTLNALFSCANLVVAYGLCVIWQWREGGCYGVEVRGRSRAAEQKKNR